MVGAITSMGLGSSLGLGRYLVSKCRLHVVITSLALAVGLWLCCSAVFLHKGRYHRAGSLTISRASVGTIGENEQASLSSKDTRKFQLPRTHTNFTAAINRSATNKTKSTKPKGWKSERKRKKDMKEEREKKEKKERKKEKEREREKDEMMKKEKKDKKEADLKEARVKKAKEKKEKEKKDEERGEKEKEEKEKEEDFHQRQLLYQKMCDGNVTGNTTNVYYNTPARLAVCLAQKAGCSYWKRIFHFLNNDTNGRRVTSPFQIDRFYVHFGSRKKTRAVPYARYKDMLDRFTKVMFARDPWSRVWSAYVDKLVLPDSWLDHGKAILRRRRRGRTQNDRLPHNVFATEKACADDVSFQEFLDYALNAVKDAHWQPVHLLCNPCDFRPRYVGKVETFSEDSAHILRKVGQERLIEGHQSHSSHSEDEMQMLTRYHFQIYATRQGLRKCLNHSGVAGRLWKAFVLNGYIADNLTFPAKQFSASLDKTHSSLVAARRATELFLKHHRSLPLPTPQETAMHRRHVMVREYRKAPRALLNKLVDVFKDDFALFGYQARPEDIFTS